MVCSIDICKIYTVYDFDRWYAVILGARAKIIEYEANLDVISKKQRGGNLKFLPGY